MQGNFKKDTTFEKRLELSTRIKTRYSDRIPVIVEVANDKELKLNRQKYLTPADISVGGFLNEIRKHATIKPEQAIFIFCGSTGGVLVPTSFTMSQIYEKYKDEDGFLYITVALENTFGCVNQIIYDVFNEILDVSCNLSNKIRNLF